MPVNLPTNECGVFWVWGMVAGAAVYWFVHWLSGCGRTPDEDEEE